MEIRVRVPRVRRLSTPVLRSVISSDDLTGLLFHLPPRGRPPLARARTIRNGKQLTRAEMAFGRATQKYRVSPPGTYGECPPAGTPCPHIRCRHHTAIEVNDIGSLKINFPGWDIDELDETCTLRAADGGPHTIPDVGRVLNISEEWVRENEANAIRKIARAIGEPPHVVKSVLQAIGEADLRRRLPIFRE